MMIRKPEHRLRAVLQLCSGKRVCEETGAAQPAYKMEATRIVAEFPAPKGDDLEDMGSAADPIERKQVRRPFARGGSHACGEFGSVLAAGTLALGARQCKAGAWGCGGGSAALTGVPQRRQAGVQLPAPGRMLLHGICSLVLGLDGPWNAGVLELCELRSALSPFLA